MVPLVRLGCPYRCVRGQHQSHQLWPVQLLPESETRVLFQWKVHFLSCELQYMQMRLGLMPPLHPPSLVPRQPPRQRLPNQRGSPRPPRLQLQDPHLPSPRACLRQLMTLAQPPLRLAGLPSPQRIHLLVGLQPPLPRRTWPWTASQQQQQQQLQVIQAATRTAWQVGPPASGHAGLLPAPRRPSCQPCPSQQHTLRWRRRVGQILLLRAASRSGLAAGCKAVAHVTPWQCHQK